MSHRFSQRYDTAQAVIVAYEVGTLENIAYVVSCRRTNHAVLVDAAAEPARIERALQGLELKAILTTHGHHDHHGAAAVVGERFDVPTLLHEADFEIAGSLKAQHLEPGEFRFGEVKATVVHTPGHTPGSICVIVDDHVLTGDTLFPGGPGATRWAYSDFEQIVGSIEREIFALDDDTTVHPGHGLPTSLGQERPSLSEWKARGW